MMKITSTGALKGVGFAVVLLSALQAHAATRTDSSYETYRCVVLGDDSACHPQEFPATPNRIVPGSYARYLIHNGMGEADALAAASAIGEEPTRQPATAEPPERIVPGSYARYLIHNGMGEADALAAARAIGEEPTRQVATVQAPPHPSAYEQASGADSHPN
jgi:hypothetical protein